MERASRRRPIQGAVLSSVRTRPEQIPSRMTGCIDLHMDAVVVDGVAEDFSTERAIAKLMLR